MWLRHTGMDYEPFYAALFAPLTATIGPIDKHTIFHIMGFDGGGPVNLSTIGIDTGIVPVTYISCELAPRQEQVPTAKGGYRYELLASCDDQRWAGTTLTGLGQMSLEVAFDHGHTIDLGLGDSGGPPIQGVLLQEECTSVFEGTKYGILRCVGITRPEMDFARAESSASLVDRLKARDVWPHTLVTRRSVV
jgi:hypothetical protein